MVEDGRGSAGHRVCGEGARAGLLVRGGGAERAKQRESQTQSLVSQEGAQVTC